MRRNLQPSLFSFFLRTLLATLVVVMPGTPAWAGSAVRRASAAITPTEVGSGGVGTGAISNAPTVRASIRRSTDVVNAVAAMQAVARDLAKANSVQTNLKVARDTDVNKTPLLWEGADKVVDSTGSLTVTQTKQQAYLQWEKFDLGTKDTLTFDQSAGGSDVNNWIAFNYVRDPDVKKSQILGTIKTLGLNGAVGGQVYILNANGILFGGTAQVNTHTLVASSLPINPQLVKRGLLNNPDGQFLFSALLLDSGKNGPTPAFDPAIKVDGLAPKQTPGIDGYGEITVAVGAQLTTPTNADHVGGRIALIGPKVTNQGYISTPDGQTILAAGLQVAWVEHASADASLRGLNAIVGAVSGVPVALLSPEEIGTVINDNDHLTNPSAVGWIEAPRGSVIMTGKTVRQLGVIDSSTSVSLNGRVDLSANYDALSSVGAEGVEPFYYYSSGTVELGANSVLQILPQWGSSDQVVGTKLALPSLVNIQGKTISMGAGSILLAPSANVPATAAVDAMGSTLTSGVSLNAGIWKLGDPNGAAQTTLFVNAAGAQSSNPTQPGYFDPADKSTITLAKDAIIDVAGSQDVQASVADNIISVELRGTELANSPLQRDGALRGATIQIDALLGTPLADVTGYIGLIQSPVDKLTKDGGTVALTAGGSVVMETGSSINVSGGSIQYNGAVVETTRLISGGHIYDISKASPDIVYDGIFGKTYSATDSKWGVTTVYSRGPLASGAHYEEGYTEAGNGGSLSIFAPVMNLEGTLLGTTATSTIRSLLPTSSSLDLVFQAQDSTIYNNNSNLHYLSFSPTAPEIVFQSSNANSAASFDSEKNVLTVSASLIDSNGFGQLKIDNRDGKITVPVDLKAAPNSSNIIELDGSVIDISGDIIVPGGAVIVNAYNIPTGILNSNLAKSPSEQLTLDPVDGRGKIILETGASLDTSGVLVDDRFGSLLEPLVTKGGSVTLVGYDVDLKAGSSVNVSGGVAINATGKATFGDAGSVAISSGRDQPIVSGQTSTDSNIFGGGLVLGADLYGYSGTKNAGTLSIQASLIQIGWNADPTNDKGATATRSDKLVWRVAGDQSDGNPDRLVLDQNFFSAGGFGTFKLTALGATTGGLNNSGLPAFHITSGTQIVPTVQNWSLSDDGKILSRENWKLKNNILATPVSLSFNALTLTDTSRNSNFLVRGVFEMDANTLIELAPNKMSGVSIAATDVDLHGEIYAPGGTISITDDSKQRQTGAVTVDLGSTSHLSTAGATQVTPNSVEDQKTGTVLDGGNITISGNIVAEAGAVIDVSGFSDVLYMSPAYSNPTSTQSDLNITTGAWIPTLVESNGGKIILKGGEDLFTNATLLGKAGGATAQGGSLSISSGLYTTIAILPEDSTLVVLGSTQQFKAGGARFLGNSVVGLDGKPITPKGYFAVDGFSAGGFDSLALSGSVRFEGSDSITINARGNLSIATNGVLSTDGKTNVSLSASYLAIGQSFPLPSDVPTTFVDSEGHAYFDLSPKFGDSSLSVSAKLIDIGNLSLQGIGDVSFNAIDGDIRGDGVLDVAGTISMRAGQIYTPTAASFTIAAYDHTEANGTAVLGEVQIASSGKRSVPLSAGGTLNIYASKIEQGGVLRAPLGTINLGLDAGDNLLDPLTKKPFINGSTGAATQSLQLLEDSVTSVSAADASSAIPYGIMLNGASWIDPKGNDITSSGIVKGSSIKLFADDITDAAGSTLDIRGGGDLFAYRWVTGAGGTNDILASSSSFAIIPGYRAEYAPFAPYNNSTKIFGTDSGYSNDSISVGQQVYLNASSGLAAGVYTLLPARYALLPGAFLVTKKSGVPSSSVTRPDGSSIVFGYLCNNLLQAGTEHSLFTSFEVDSASVIAARAQYTPYFANSVIKQSAAAQGVSEARLPVDSGRILLSATQTMILQGKVSAQSALGGRGGLVDISSPADISIVGKTQTSTAGGLVLNASDLSNFGADSLLIGGQRTVSSDGTSVTARTNNITVDNEGTPLDGAKEIILVAKQTLAVKDGAVIESSGESNAPAAQLLFGTKDQAGTGDGVALRVTGDSSAGITRATGSVSPSQTLGLALGIGNATLKGTGVLLDSTNKVSLASGANLDSQAITLSSGLISLNLDGKSDRAGLQLTNGQLQTLQKAKSLSLLSYTSIDTYGSGTVGSSNLGSLSLHAGEIRGFNLEDGETVTFAAAHDLFLDNSVGGAGVDIPAAGSGTLAFNADVIHFGTANSEASQTINLDQYSAVEMTAQGGVVIQGQGSLNAGGKLTIVSPVITGAAGAKVSVAAAGDLTLSGSGKGTVDTTGLGASLSLTGANVTLSDSIVLASGSLNVRATGGDIAVGGLLDVSGTAKKYYDVTKYTAGGQIGLISDTGSVTLASTGAVNVSSPSSLVSAGALSISAVQGDVNLFGTLNGQSGGVGGQGGTFSLDYKPTTDVALGTLNQLLSDKGFTYSQSYRVRDHNVTLDGTATAHSFNLSADNGSITVTGKIDASGQTGGTIKLAAYDSVNLAPNALLDASGQYYDDAGKGGSVSLATRAHETVDSISGDYVYDATMGISIDPTARISLGVKEQRSTSDVLAGNSVTNRRDLADGGTLHLRAPRDSWLNSNHLSDVVSDSVSGADSVVVEGFKVYDRSAIEGVIDTVEDTAKADAITYYTQVHDKLNESGTSVPPNIHFQPGVEIVNTTGDLKLGETWDLSSWRFGDSLEPGVLTLRAAGNLIFQATVSRGKMVGAASLSDGFTALTEGTTGYSASQAQNLWLAPLGTGKSWSYELVAGADFSAADARQVLPLTKLVDGSGLLTGSLLLGQGSLALPETISKSTTKAGIIASYYQTIRTGTGDIDIHTGRDVQLLNPLATIYTAGRQVDNATQLFTANDFDTPKTAIGGSSAITGTNYYGVYYGVGGGNVTLQAQGNIAHHIVAADGSGTLTADSSKEMPTNWLYRRGNVGTDGLFATNANSASTVQSTTWWIDYSNFFEGVGALGGGNVALVAQGNVTNVDAVVPTNARMPGYTNNGSGNQIASPDATKLVELGGGDLTVRAGQDISGGVYYVERGQGVLSAGNNIDTNDTRAAVVAGALEQNTPEAVTLLPTTLFLGKGSFDVSAGGDLLLGPVANPFLLPQGINNGYYNKSFFSTYATYDSVEVASLYGNVTLKDAADSISESSMSVGSLSAWYDNVLTPFDKSGALRSLSLSTSQPWLRLCEVGDASSTDSGTVAGRFSVVASVMPATLRATSFTGDINLVGKLVLSPSATGTIDLVAAGAINGVQLNGANNLTNPSAGLLYGSSLINLSDADPAKVPGVATPLYAYTVPGGITPDAKKVWSFASDMSSIAALFSETGATTGSLQDKQARHQQGTLLHANDATPLHLYALGGDISGLTLYASKAAKVIASQDITDIAFYIQNNAVSDISIIAAGRDLILYQPNSALRLAQQALGYVEGATTPGILTPASSTSTAGDIQISGPGTLEVLAGRNLELGAVKTNSDGTSNGITSIGNQRNTALPFAGADVIAAAGIGLASGLEAVGTSGMTNNTSLLGFQNFIAEFLNPNTNPTTTGNYWARYLPVLAELMGRTDLSDPQQIWTAFNDDNNISPAYRAQLVMDVFYRVLRDTGRDYNDPDASGFRSYQMGRDAIAALFPAKASASGNLTPASGYAWQGDLSLSSREIRTTNGGSISLFAPGGQLSLGYDLPASGAAPPGILTEHGGGISIFTNGNVDVGAMRIFTLRGGDEVIWSSTGNIAAGVSSKTVQSAPPTRVLIDPQTADVKPDLAGLATGGGIGVLASVAGVQPGDVDLIAPVGTIDAGDAGIRSSGKINVSAVLVVNAANIQSSAGTSGTPVVVAPNISGLTTASNTAAGTSSSVGEAARQQQRSAAAQQQEMLPSIIQVEVLGYGGGEGEDVSKKKDESGNG